MLKCSALRFKLEVQRERMSGEGKVVCVTGASGFIASWLVKLLLEHGYTVKATVRDPDDPNIKHLHTLDGATERLHIFKANLMEEGSFDSAIDGCEGVFHTASPVFLSTNDPQAELIDPAVKGTLNVLRSCAEVQSVKRVVITSSTASVFFNERPLTPDVVADETWFSDPDFCKKSKNWYALSKTLAEQAARKFAKENEIDLVTLHPGFVIGPSLHSKLNLSLEVILNIIKGVDTFPRPYRFVDVRDVAYAHVQALEVPTASGRYLLVGKVTQRCEVLKILQEHYPTLHLPEKFKAADCEPTYQISKDRTKSLGINFMPLEVTFRDTVESLKEKGFLNF